MGFFDEEYAPQQLDDHDLMFRMRKKLKKVCGCYWIDFESDPSWGASRKETTGFSESQPYQRQSHTTRTVNSFTRDIKNTMMSTGSLKIGSYQNDIQ